MTSKKYSQSFSDAGGFSHYVGGGDGYSGVYEGEGKGGGGESVTMYRPSPHKRRDTSWRVWGETSRFLPELPVDQPSGTIIDPAHLSPQQNPSSTDSTRLLQPQPSGLHTISLEAPPMDSFEEAARS
ncbi:hypothetical protein F5878DRAFT_667649 [Lentinula raphanica]|uniref:Uncharacterized protein n=1 Tax=Lentinula raphanica TaxID=153919 RepID=A0AA38U9M8_9AGAR|nr:hypothetical protein F5878DRAFT_667649 [Lentinula raphanica]